MHRFAALGGADGPTLQALLAASIVEWNAAGLRVAGVTPKRTTCPIGPAAPVFCATSPPAKSIRCSLTLSPPAPPAISTRLAWTAPAPRCSVRSPIATWSCSANSESWRRRAAVSPLRSRRRWPGQTRSHHRLRPAPGRMAPARARRNPSASRRGRNPGLVGEDRRADCVIMFRTVDAVGTGQRSAA